MRIRKKGGLAAWLLVSLWLIGPVREVQAESKSVKVFMGIDSADEVKFKFAISMADKIFRDKNLSKNDSQAQILVLGEAFKFLINDVSPITSDMYKFKQQGFNLRLIGCGKAVPAMKQYLKEGKAALLPGVELIDEPCDDYRAKLIQNGWVEIEIPDNI